MNKQKLAKVVGPKGHLIKSIAKLRDGVKKTAAQLMKMEQEVEKEVMAAGQIIATEFQQPAKAPKKKRARSSPTVDAALAAASAEASPRKRGRKPKAAEVPMFPGGVNLAMH